MGSKRIVLTAMAAAVATVLSGGAAAYAAPGPSAPDPAAVRGVQEQVRKMAATAAPTDETKFGDVTGDGKADLMAIDREGRLFVYPGRAVVYSGTGERPRTFFDRRVQAGTGWQSFLHVVRHGDWNNDGKQDVLATTTRGWLVFYAGTGNVAQPVANGVVIGYGWADFYDLVGIGDGNGDGFDDLIGRKFDGTLVRYEGTGTTSPAFRRHPVTSGTGWYGPELTSVGDWTGDGVSEFVFLNADSELWLYRGRPGSGFPANSPERLGDSKFGASIAQMVGMGNLTSDASAATALPDLVFTDAVQGGLWAVAPDTGASFDGSLGTGWSGYQLF